MNEATYATMRDASGVTPQRLAELTGAPLETVLSWEAPGGDPPPNVQGFITDLMHSHAQALADTMRLAAGGTTIHLMRYADEFDYYAAYGNTTPLHVYHRLLSITHTTLTAIGATVHVHYFNPTTYGRWLDGRPDTEAHRTDWFKSLTDTDTAAQQLLED